MSPYLEHRPDINSLQTVKSGMEIVRSVNFQFRNEERS